MNKGDATNNAKIKVISIEWLVPHYTPSIDQKNNLLKQIVKKVPTDIHYVERSVFMQVVKNQKVWQFQIWVEEGINIPIFKKIGFQQQDKENSQSLNNDTFLQIACY